MLRFLFTGLLSLMIISTYAQSDSFVKEENTKLFSPDEKKNSFGVSVTPVVVILGGATQSNPTIAMLYRRYMGKYNWRIRGSFGAEEYFTNPTSAFRIINDSVLRTYNHQYTQTNADLRFGMERYFPGKSRSRFLYGVDVIVGYVNDRQDVYQIERKYEKDSAGVISFTSEFFPQGPPPPPSYLQKHFIKTGLSTVVGYDLFLGQRWNLGIQIAADMAFQFQIAQTELDPDQLIEAGNGREVRSEFDINALDMYVSYRF